jgi:hypothetical protein
MYSTACNSTDHSRLACIEEIRCFEEMADTGEQGMDLRPVLMYTGIRSSRNRISEILEFDLRTRRNPVPVCFSARSEQEKRAKILFLLQQEMKNRNPVPGSCSNEFRCTEGPA